MQNYASDNCVTGVQSRTVSSFYIYFQLEKEGLHLKWRHSILTIVGESSSIVYGD